MVDFVFAISELFSLSLVVETFEGGGWVTLSADFGGKGASPTNHCWCQSSRVIVLSYGVKISAVTHLDLSRSTRVTDIRTDGQNYDSHDRPRICSPVKTLHGPSLPLFYDKTFDSYISDWITACQSSIRTSIYF